MLTRTKYTAVLYNEKNGLSARLALVSDDEAASRGEYRYIWCCMSESDDGISHRTSTGGASIHAAIQHAKSVWPDIQISPPESGSYIGRPRTYAERPVRVNVLLQPGDLARLEACPGESRGKKIVWLMDQIERMAEQTINGSK